MGDPNRDDRRSNGSLEDDTDNEPSNRTEREAADIDSGTDSGHRTETGRNPRNESTQVVDEERRRKISVTSLLVATLGVWVALSTLVLETGTAPLWNNVLVGLVVGVAAGYNYYRLANDIPLSTAIASLVAILGIWLIVSAALLEMTGGVFWNTVASGLLIAGLAGYNAYEARDARTIASEPETGA